jgi:hypothetical protein
MALFPFLTSFEFTELGYGVAFAIRNLPAPLLVKEVNAGSRGFSPQASRWGDKDSSGQVSFTSSLFHLNP